MESKDSFDDNLISDEVLKNPDEYEIIEESGHILSTADNPSAQSSQNLLHSDSQSLSTSEMYPTAPRNAYSFSQPSVSHPAANPPSSTLSSSGTFPFYQYYQNSGQTSSTGRLTGDSRMNIGPAMDSSQTVFNQETKTGGGVNGNSNGSHSMGSPPFSNKTASMVEGMFRRLPSSTSSTLGLTSPHTGVLGVGTANAGLGGVLPAYPYSQINMGPSEAGYHPSYLSDSIYSSVYDRGSFNPYALPVAGSGSNPSAAVAFDAGPATAEHNPSYPSTAAQSISQPPPKEQPTIEPQPQVAASAVPAMPAEGLLPALAPSVTPPSEKIPESSSTPQHMLDTPPDFVAKESGSTLLSGQLHQPSFVPPPSDEETPAAASSVNTKPPAVVPLPRHKAPKLPVFTYRSGGRMQLPDLAPYCGHHVHIRVEAQDWAWSSPAVRDRQLWGDKIYTDDSDLIAMLLHQGLMKIDPRGDETRWEEMRVRAQQRRRLEGLRRDGFETDSYSQLQPGKAAAVGGSSGSRGKEARASHHEAGQGPGREYKRRQRQRMARQVDLSEEESGPETDPGRRVAEEEGEEAEWEEEALHQQQHGVTLPRLFPEDYNPVDEILDQELNFTKEDLQRIRENGRAADPYTQYQRAHHDRKRGQCRGEGGQAKRRKGLPTDGMYHRPDALVAREGWDILVTLKIHPPQPVYNSVAHYHFKSQGCIGSLHHAGQSLEIVQAHYIPSSTPAGSELRVVSALRRFFTTPAEARDPALLPHYAFALLKDDLAHMQSHFGRAPQPVLESAAEVMFNFNHEPCLAYSLSSIGDCSLDTAGWTEGLLLSHALYLETATERYELCRLPRQVVERVVTPPPSAHPPSNEAKSAADPTADGVENSSNAGGKAVAELGAVVDKAPTRGAVSPHHIYRLCRLRSPQKVLGEVPVRETLKVLAHEGPWSSLFWGSDSLVFGAHSAEEAAELSRNANQQPTPTRTPSTRSFPNPNLHLTAPSAHPCVLSPLRLFWRAKTRATALPRSDSALFTPDIDSPPAPGFPHSPPAESTPPAASVSS